MTCHRGSGKEANTTMSELAANHLLNGLDPHELSILRPHFSEVPLDTGTVVAEVGHPAEFVYFPTEGVLSLVGTTEVLTRQIRDCGELHERILRYSETVILQVGQSAICNRFHNAKQRLARWLLMTVDRAGTRQLPLTHEFISYMVGGPRSAVTEAAAALRDSGAIDYRRGLVHVRDRERLQQESCECYSAVQSVLNPKAE